jgi:hypothetical protein
MFYFGPIYDFGPRHIHRSSAHRLKFKPNVTNERMRQKPIDQQRYSKSKARASILLGDKLSWQ